MNNQHRKNRITILVIFAMSIVPFAIAWYLAAHPQTVKLGTNNGDLISPPLTTELTDFSGYDSFSAQNINELTGHWILINPVTTAQCHELCLDALYKSHQIALMMGKDIARIRRMVLMPEAGQEPVLNQQWQQDARLLKVNLSDSLRQKILQTGAYQAGSLLVMDPLGNLMMKYAPGFDPYKVRNDLSKLLRISQIG